MKQATKKLNGLEKKVQNSLNSNDGNKKTPNSGTGGSDTPKKTTKDRVAPWHIKKKGSTIEHERTKYNWYPLHKSKDGNFQWHVHPLPP